jgi:hypothetical protein
MGFMVQDQALKAGQRIRVPFRADGLPDVAAWQFALRFDTDYLRFERALPTAAFPLKDENFGAWQADRGELRSVFAVPQGLVLPKEEVIFELEFQVVRGGLRLSEVLRLDNSILDGRVYNTALSGGAVALSFERDGKLPSVELPGEVVLEQNIPNPFDGQTLIRFQLPEAGEAVFSVHDVQGRLLYEQRGFFDAGLQEVRLDAARLGAAGVLSYTLRSGAHGATRRMVIVR